MNTTATFTKLRSGDWGVRAPVGVAVGDTIRVAKKSGGTTSVTVAKVLWRGDTEALCAIGARREMPARRQQRGGAAAPVRGYSSWCTGRDDCGCFDCGQN